MGPSTSGETTACFFDADLVLRRGVFSPYSSSILTSPLPSESSTYVTVPRDQDDMRTPVDIDADIGMGGGAISVLIGMLG